jgi:hypothetical protein
VFRQHAAPAKVSCNFISVLRDRTRLWRKVSALNMVEGAQASALAVSEITRPWRVNEPVRSC